MTAKEFVEFVTEKAKDLEDQSNAWLVWDKNAPLGDWWEQFVIMIEMGEK